MTTITDKAREAAQKEVKYALWRRPEDPEEGAAVQALLDQQAADLRAKLEQSEKDRGELKLDAAATRADAQALRKERDEAKASHKHEYDRSDFGDKMTQLAIDQRDTAMARAEEAVQILTMIKECCLSGAKSCTCLISTEAFLAPAQSQDKPDDEAAFKAALSKHFLRPDCADGFCRDIWNEALAYARAVPAQAQGDAL